MIKKLFASLGAVAALATVAHAQNSSGCFDALKGTDEATPLISPKFNFQLERTIVEAQTAGIDLSSVLIAGIMKTKSDVATPEQAALLFNDENTVVRSIIPNGDTNIITFSSSLAGVLNAARADSILVISMSQKLPGTAGMTVRN